MAETARMIGNVMRITPGKTAALGLVAVLAAGCTSGKSTEQSTASPAKASKSTVAPSPTKPRTFIEVQQFGAPTFGDYEHAAEPGKYMPEGTMAEVDCVEHGPVEAAPSVHGLWYHLKGPSPYGTGNSIYVAANTFWNQETKPTGPLDQQPAVDSQVPDCDAASFSRPLGTLPLTLLSPEAPLAPRPAA